MLKFKWMTSVAVLLILLHVYSVFADENERILIVYFTWAENTEIIDRDKAIRDANSHVYSMEGETSVDAVTSASVIAPGNTRRLAEWIKEYTGGDLFSIRVKDKYSCYWKECLDQSEKEKSTDARPELAVKIENFADYDTVFLGFPTWWYSIPMPVASFVESYDFSNKKIIPFVSHGTSGIANTIKDLKKLLPSSVELKKEIGVYRSETRSAESKIIEWLNGIRNR